MLLSNIVFAVTLLFLRAISAGPIHLADALEKMQLERIGAMLSKRLVVNEKITSPDSSTVWYTGQKGVSVTWNVTADAAGYKGKVLLGWLSKNRTEDPSEHLNLNALASGFSLTDGKVTFDLPCNDTIKPRDTYVVALMGDSGNISPTFTILRNEMVCPNLVSAADAAPACTPSN